MYVGKFNSSLLGIFFSSNRKVLWDWGKIKILIKSKRRIEVKARRSINILFLDAKESSYNESYQINRNRIIYSKYLSFTTDSCDGEAEDNPAHSSGDHNCTEAGDDTEEADDIHKT